MEGKKGDAVHLNSYLRIYISLFIMALIKYYNTNFGGVCVIDSDFEIYLDAMNDVLKDFDMEFIVTSSFRRSTNVKGAIVPPAKRSNHMVGHAIDGNIRCKRTGKNYNSKKMGDGIDVDDLCCAAIERETGLTWGQMFSTPDPVHFDDRLNIENPKLWQAKYKEFQ